MHGRSERESQPCPRDSTVSTFEKSPAVNPLSSQNSDTWTVQSFWGVLYFNIYIIYILYIYIFLL